MLARIKSQIQIFDEEVRNGRHAFRMLLAFCVLGDLLIRLWHKDLIFLSDDGPLPRAAVNSSVSLFSAYMWSGSTLWVGLLTGLHAGAAVAYGMGWRPKWTSVILWYFTGALLVRARMALNSDTNLLFAILLFLVFIEYESTTRRRPIWSVFGLTLILGSIYYASGLAKTSAIWREGLALQYILNAKFETREWSQSLLAWPSLLAFASRAVSLAELASPGWILLLPIHRTFRRIVTAALILFHLTTAAIFSLGPFPWIGVAVWLYLGGWLGSRDFSSRLVEPPGPVWPVRILLVGAIVLWFMSYGPIQFRTEDARPRLLRRAAALFGFDNSWQLFTIREGEVLFDFVDIVMKRPDGQNVSLITGQDPESWMREGRLRDYPSAAWFSFLRDFRQRPHVAPYLEKYICREFLNDGGEWSVVNYRIHAVKFEKSRTRILAQGVCTGP